MSSASNIITTANTDTTPFLTAHLRRVHHSHAHTPGPSAVQLMARRRRLQLIEARLGGRRRRRRRRLGLGGVSLPPAGMLVTRPPPHPPPEREPRAGRGQEADAGRGSDADPRRGAGGKPGGGRRRGGGGRTCSGRGGRGLRRRTTRGRLGVAVATSVSVRRSWPRQKGSGGGEGRDLPAQRKIGRMRTHHNHHPHRAQGPLRAPGQDEREPARGRDRRPRGGGDGHRVRLGRRPAPAGGEGGRGEGGGEGAGVVPAAGHVQGPYCEGRAHEVVRTGGDESRCFRVSHVFNRAEVWVSGGPAVRGGVVWRGSRWGDIRRTACGQRSGGACRVEPVRTRRCLVLYRGRGLVPVRIARGRRRRAEHVRDVRVVVPQP